MSSLPWVVQSWMSSSVALVWYAFERFKQQWPHCLQRNPFGGIDTLCCAGLTPGSVSPWFPNKIGYPQRLTMAEIAIFNKEKSRLPKKAEPNPRRWIPGTSPDTNHSMRALTTNKKSPNVSIVNGKVRITMTGFTKKLTRPKTMAPMNAEPQPSTYKPGTSLETNMRRAALIIRRTKSSTIPLLYLPSRCCSCVFSQQIMVFIPFEFNKVK